MSAIAGHAPVPRGPARRRRWPSWLFAVDELAGFVVACALVRPQRLEGLKASSVRKKLKSSGVRGGGAAARTSSRAPPSWDATQADLIELVVSGLLAEADALGLHAEPA